MSGYKSHKELQSLLDSTPGPFTGNPPVETRLQVLPFNDLPWEKFEQLCARLVQTEQAIFDCYRYGKPGEEQSGVDILARRWVEGRVEKWAFQCKRYSRYTASDAQQALDSFHFPADHFVLCLSLLASKDVRDIVAQRPIAQLWDTEDLSRRLKNHPKLVEDFFGSGWRKAFCGEIHSATPYSRQSDVSRLIGIGLSHQESLFSNLIPFRQLPKTIFRGSLPLRPSSVSTPQEAERTPLYKTTRQFAFTFANLRDRDIAGLMGCDFQSARDIPLSRWLAQPLERSWFRDLFYLYLQRKCHLLGLAYDSRHRRFYFTPQDGGERVIHYQAFRRQAKRRVAYPYYGKATGKLAFWVHHAARLSLVEFDDSFFLRIEPGYAFTENGYDFMASEDIGPLVTRRKSGERNQNAFNHIVFWAEVLAGSKPVIEVHCDGQLFLIEKLGANGEADFGIPADSRSIQEVATEQDELDPESLGETNEEIGLE